MTLVVAEASLETIPLEIWNQPLIQRHSRRLKKKPEFMLLDKSYHYHAMTELEDKDRRGRPDIVHFTLLTALGSPLNLEGLLQIYVHTRRDLLVTVHPQTRLPRNYNRFIGLIEQLFRDGRVPQKGQSLLTVKKLSLSDLLKELKPSFTLALTEEGEPMSPRQAAQQLMQQQHPVVLIGGFPRGVFTQQTFDLIDGKVSIDPTCLDAWVVAARIIASYEDAIGLPEKRLSQYCRDKKVK